MPRLCAQTAGLGCLYTHLSAWQSFQNADAVLAALAGAALLAALVGPAAGERVAEALDLRPQFGRTVGGVVVAALGWAAVALSIWVVQRPAIGERNIYPSARPSVTVIRPGASPEFGFFVALLAAGGIAAGGWWLALARPAD